MHYFLDLQVQKMTLCNVKDNSALQWRTTFEPALLCVINRINLNYRLNLSTSAERTEEELKADGHSLRQSEASEAKTTRSRWF